MINAVVHHRVADFVEWKHTYDGFREEQRKRGVRAHQVQRSTEDPSIVVVSHSFESLKAAREFFEDPGIGAVMGQAGVDPSSFSVEYLDEIVSGPL